MQHAVKWISLALVAALLAGSPLFAGPPSDKTKQCRKDLAAATTALKAAQADYDKAVDVIRKKLAENPEWKGVVEAYKKALQDYDAATKAALATVHASKEYLAAVKARDDAKAKLTDLTANPNPNPADLTAAGNAQMAATTTIKSLEETALATDPKVLAAKAALDAAKAKMDEFNKQVATLAAADTACQEKQKALDEAQKKVTEAKEALAASIKEDNQNNKNSHGGDSGGSGKGRSGMGGGGGGGVGAGGGAGGPK